MTIAPRLQQLAHRGVDLLFPLVCVGCGREGAWLCPVCAVTVSFIPLIKNQTGSLDRIVALLPYADRVINRLIRAYKYRGGSGAGPAIASLVRRGLSPTLLPDVDAVLPLPLERMKLFDRGFNQVDGIADAVGGIVGKPVERDFFVRLRSGEPQAKKSADERHAGIPEGTFSITLLERVIGRRFVIIDDVYTTGATMEAAARTLRIHGAAAVSGFAFAYGG